MTITAYSDGGVSPRTNVYAERQMLRHAKPVMVLEKLGLTKPMPKNKTDTIKFRRPKIFTAATTPLIEGVTPTETQFSYEDVSATLRQYGQVVVITDKIEDLHEDPVLNDASVQAGENIGRTIEALNYGIIRAGTSVYYANGTARTDVNTPITLTKQRAVLRTLKANKAQKITRSLSPSSDYGTRAVEAAYVAVAHTDVESDIRNLPGFKTTAEYGTRSPLSEYEIGSVEDVRYLLCPTSIRSSMPVARRARWCRPAAPVLTSTRSSSLGRTLGGWWRLAAKVLFLRRLFQLDRRPKTIRSGSVGTSAGRRGMPP